MKSNAPAITLLLISVLLAGCSNNDKYDLASQKVEKERQANAPVIAEGKEITLPAGITISEDKVIHKGDKLPDGTVATENSKAKTFTIESDAK